MTSGGPATRLEMGRQEGSGSAQTHHAALDRHGRHLPGHTRRLGCVPGGAEPRSQVLWGGLGEGHGHASCSPAPDTA